jgi:hypothetical protein
MINDPVTVPEVAQRVFQGGLARVMITESTKRNPMTTNRYSMMDAFTPEEFAVLYDLVMFHDADECPEWMDATVRDKVFEKISDVMTEYNKGAA